MSKRDYGKCKCCGTDLNRKQKVFCSRTCSAVSKVKQKEFGYCETCNKIFEIKSYKQRFCSKSCASENEQILARRSKDLDRPYTCETRKIIRMWVSKGDSIEKVAMALGRSIENVKKALV